MSFTTASQDAEARRFAGGSRVAVLLPVPVGETWDYRVGDGLELGPGDIVEVPFAGRRMAGVVWGEGRGDVADAKLRDVAFRFDSPPLPEVSRRFVDWVAAYTVHGRGAVLRMAISVPDALRVPRPARALTLTDPLPEVRWTKERERVRDVLAGAPPRSAAEIAREAGVGAGVLQGLVRAGVLKAVTVLAAPPKRPDWRLPGLTLSRDQERAAAEVRGSVGAGFAVTVIDGVAGSGKTEVYFEAVAAALAAGRQVLVLLPEIALGAQWLTRFRDRFGAPPAQWHSELSQTVRRATWRAVAEGTAPVVVGARSALFLPYADLGLIVVDEEHDGSYKQEDGVTYNARDMAVVRARLGDIPALLVSATPSLETVLNVRSDRYRAVHLPDRHTRLAPPKIELVDLRHDKPPRGAWLSPSLREALAGAIAEGSQAMLFLNRRGYAPLTLCRACGHRIRCPHCSAWLVEHRLVGRLQCHHCGLAVPIPATCPSCATEDSLAGCGPGVERIAEEVAAVLPQARVALATSDTLTGPKAAAELVRRVESHEVDVLVGTQILAKGYHFPLLVLVGIVDADLGLAGGDLRASERTFQLLHQVAGRAGRAERPGRVVLQTYMPEHPVIAALALGDREGFLAAETEARREAGMPPFGRLAALIVSGRDEAAVEAAARELAAAAPASEDVRVLGPAPAPLALLRGRHRRRLLLVAARSTAVSHIVRDWLSRVPHAGSVRVQVDIDPYGFH